MPSSPLIGNEPARALLLRMLAQNRVPHTLLFYGPEGVGKGAHALYFAECLMGSPSVAKIRSGNHPDLHVLRPEGKAGLHPVESIRALLKEATLPPFEAPVKVFIIYDAHHMLPASSNALLKTLEEPTPHTYFLLLTSQLESILPTIISRSRKIAFFPIPDKDIARFAKEQWGKDEKEALRIAFLAHGSLDKAYQLSSQTKEQERSLLHALVSLILPQDYAQLLALCDEVEKSLGEEDADAPSILESFLENLFAWYRDLHLLRNGVPLEYLYHLDAIQLLQEKAKKELPSLERVLGELLKVRLGLQRHVKVRVVLEQFFLSIN